MSGSLMQLYDRYPDLLPCRENIDSACSLLVHAFRAGNKLMVCGNGGSAADSEHIVGELMKGFRLPRKLPGSEREILLRLFPSDGERIANTLQGALPAIALTGSLSLATAFANDVSSEMVFAQQVYGYGATGDVLVVISTSGKSANVMRAAQVARMKGVNVVGLTGPDGGPLASLCDIAVRVPGNNTAEVQERHLPVYHEICTRIEQEFFG
ncbi:MAG TPA: SIS domain-containing protein [Spirochaetia bacterium]|nr:SIS domain-containing protein [Spirochaetia bacterium]